MMISKEIILTDKAPSLISVLSQGPAVGGIVYFSGWTLMDPGIVKDRTVFVSPIKNIEN